MSKTPALKYDHFDWFPIHCLWIHWLAILQNISLLHSPRNQLTRLLVGVQSGRAWVVAGGWSLGHKVSQALFFLLLWINGERSIHLKKSQFRFACARVQSRGPGSGQWFTSNKNSAMYQRRVRTGFFHLSEISTLALLNCLVVSIVASLVVIMVALLTYCWLTGGKS